MVLFLVNAHVRRLGAEQRVGVFIFGARGRGEDVDRRAGVGFRLGGGLELGRSACVCGRTISLFLLLSTSGSPILSAGSPIFLSTGMPTTMTSCFFSADLPWSMLLSPMYVLLCSRLYYSARERKSGTKSRDAWSLAQKSGGWGKIE